MCTPYLSFKKIFGHVFYLLTSIDCILAKYYSGGELSRIKYEFGYIFRVLRFFFGLVFLYFGVIAVRDVLYSQGGVYNLPKFLQDFIPDAIEWRLTRRVIWCFGWTTIGFAMAAFNSSRLPAEQSHKNPIPSYSLFYPGFLIVNSLLIYGILNLNNAPGRVFFYPVSAFLCLNLAFWIDPINFRTMVDSILKKMADKILDSK